MKSILIVILSLAIVCQQTLAISISDLLVKISEEQEYLQKETALAKEGIDFKINKQLANFNSYALQHLDSISKDLAACHAWAGPIIDTKNEMNEKYALQTCEKAVEFTKLKEQGLTLVVMLKTAEYLETICSKPGSNCGPQIEAMDRSLDEVHEQIEGELKTLLAGVDGCLQAKFDSAIDNVYKTIQLWSYCMANSR